MQKIIEKNNEAKILPLLKPSIVTNVNDSCNSDPIPNRECCRYRKKNLPKKGRLKVEPTMRFELTTSSLPRKRSTPELSRQKIKKKSQADVLVVIF